MSFKDLKRNSSKSLENLTAEINKVSGEKFSNNDDRYWQPTVDKFGNGSAVIRFLPPKEDESAPFVKMYDHGFKGPGGWYIEKSLTTIGQDDPVAKYNKELWDSNIEANRKRVSVGTGKGDPGSKRKLSYVSNIYVVSDPEKPENEGKVFLYGYGKKIFDKLNDAAFPQFPDEPKFDPFNFWEGANFRLRIRKVDGFRNYDKSSFDECGPLFDDDDKLEEVYGRQFSLKDLHEAKNFKSYEKLEERLNKILGNEGSKLASLKAEDLEEDEVPTTFKETSGKKFKEEDEDITNDSSDDDDDLDIFKKLSEED